MATILAQPKILALSGQYAVFQVGGEIPIRIISSFVAQVEFKPFGTLVNFLPRVSEEGDIILTVTPEVSQPEFNNRVEGIPTFRTRRASTTARLGDGETLVIGGLMQTQKLEEVRGVPYLQDIPIAGFAFRNTTYVDEVTELMVIVTPHIVNPIPAGESLALPTDRPPLTNEEIRTKPEPEKASRPRFPGLGTGGTLPGLP
jgi:pilus assembly protein CpaC